MEHYSIVLVLDFFFNASQDVVDLLEGRSEGGSVGELFSIDMIGHSQCSGDNL